MYLISGAHRHRTLVDDDLVVLHQLSDLLRDPQNVFQISRTVLVLGRGQGQENDVPMVKPFLQGGGKSEPARLDVSLKKHIQVGLINRDLPLLHAPYLGLVDIHTDHFIPGLCQAGPGDQAHVAGAYYGDFHIAILS